MKRTFLFMVTLSGVAFLAADPLHFFRDVVAHVASVVLVMGLGIREHFRNRDPNSSDPGDR